MPINWWANKGDVLNCCGKMPSLRKACLPELLDLPKRLRMSPSPTTGLAGCKPPAFRHGAVLTVPWSSRLPPLTGEIHV